MSRTTNLIEFADEVDTDVVTYELYVDGERHNGQTRAEVDSRQDDDEHGGGELIAASTEHRQHDDVAGDSEHTEDEQQTDNDIEFDATVPPRDRQNGVACRRADRHCRVVHGVLRCSTAPTTTDSYAERCGSRPRVCLCVCVSVRAKSKKKLPNRN